MTFLSRILGRQDGDDLTIRERDYVAQRNADDVVIDVRTAGEYAQGHLAGASNIDVTAPDFGERIDALSLPLDRPVYLYCRTGNRSHRATQILRGRGFDKAYNIGGFDALVDSGAEAER